MCHFLPVYYLGIAFLGRGEGSKYNSKSLYHKIMILSKHPKIMAWDLLTVEQFLHSLLIADEAS